MYLSLLWLTSCSLSLSPHCPFSLYCFDSLPPFPWVSGFLPPLRVTLSWGPSPPTPFLDLWSLFLWPPSLSQLPGFPPLPATSQARPSIPVAAPRLAGCVSPPPPAALAPRPVPPASLSWAGRGIPPGSWKKQLGPRERPSVSPGTRPPPSGLGVSPGVGQPEAGSPAVSGFSQAASGSGPRPPANSPNIIPREESVVAGGGPG